jgi:hypothetical protein
MRLPRHFDARRFDNPHDRRRDFRADAVAGDECDSMFHKSRSQKPESRIQKKRKALPRSQKNKKWFQPDILASEF